MEKRWKKKKHITIVASCMVALSLAAAPGVARAEDAASVPEWAIDDGGDDQGEAGLTA